jgi:hypothetical protein
VQKGSGVEREREKESEEGEGDGKRNGEAGERE